MFYSFIEIYYRLKLAVKSKKCFHLFYLQVVGVSGFILSGISFKIFFCFHLLNFSFIKNNAFYDAGFQ